MEFDPIPCICCGAGLESSSPDLDSSQPLGGLAFRTHGHYGSGAFDPMDGSSIEIVVCDPCVEEAGRAGHVLHVVPVRPVQEPALVVPWQPAAEFFEEDESVADVGAAFERGEKGTT